MATTSRLMTADELLQMPDDGMCHELVAGELRTVAPSGVEHGWLAGTIAVPLGHYVRTNRLGLVYIGEAGFVLARDPDTVRVPDVAFVRRERVLAAGDVKGYWSGAPDLIVKVISPNDRRKDVADKIASWLQHGARMVLVADPRRRAVTVHRPAQPVRTLTEAEVVDGEDVAPGWTLPVRDVFAHGLAD